MRLFIQLFIHSCKANGPSIEIPAMRTDGSVGAGVAEEGDSGTEMKEHSDLYRAVIKNLDALMPGLYQ